MAEGTTFVPAERPLVQAVLALLAGGLCLYLSVPALAGLILKGGLAGWGRLVVDEAPMPVAFLGFGLMFSYFGIVASLGRYGVAVDRDGITVHEGLAKTRLKHGDYTLVSEDGFAKFRCVEDGKAVEIELRASVEQLQSSIARATS